MAEKFNTVPLGKVGDVVYYTGQESYIKGYTDEYTRSEMHKYLNIGESYTIRLIGNYSNYHCDHYKFYEESTGEWFPCNSFTSNIREFMNKRYNLR